LFLLRRYFAGLPEQEVGWLAAAYDPIIEKFDVCIREHASWTLLS
jgi:hypothetical protein